MGNTPNSRPFHDKSNLQSKSIPNIRCLSDESEQFYFAQALKLQEQFSIEKSIQQQQQTQHRHHIDQMSLNRFGSVPNHSQFCHENILRHSAAMNQPLNTCDHHEQANSVKLTKKKASRKFNKFFKLGSNNTENRAAMTKSLVFIGSNSGNNCGFGQHENEKYNMNPRNVNYLEANGYSKSSVGTRLSFADSFKMCDEGIKGMHFGVDTSEKKLRLGSTDLNKSIDLNECHTDLSKLKYLTTTKHYFNQSQNSSSSGCSSATSSSNLSSTRRIHQRPDSVLSTWSTNKMSTPSPPPPIITNFSNQKSYPQALALKNYSSSVTPHLNPATSTKSILSDSASKQHDSSALAKCSPLEAEGSQRINHPSNLNGLISFSGVRAFPVEDFGEKNSDKLRSSYKEKASETNLVKSDSTNSFNSICVMKPNLSMFQSSISSTGVTSSCGFASSETSSISNPKADISNQLNYTGSVKLAKRTNNRFHKAKSESMYVREPISHTRSSPDAHSNTSKKLKKKTKTKQRDSGILVDLFNINGSVNNLRTKLNNATSSLRNSISTFNLRSFSIKKGGRSKKSSNESGLNSANAVAKQECDMSDLDIDNEYDNSDDNYISHSEEEGYNEIYQGVYKTMDDNNKIHSQNINCTRIKSSLSNNVISTGCVTENSCKSNTKQSLSKQHSFLSQAYTVPLSTDVKTTETNEKHNFNQTIVNTNIQEQSHEISLRPSTIKLTKQSQPNFTRMSFKSQSSLISNLTSNNHNQQPISSSTILFSDKKRANNQLPAHENLENLKNPSVPTYNTFKAVKHNYSTFSRQFSHSKTYDRVSDEIQPPTTTTTTAAPTTQHKKIVVQASTNDLLNCFAQFIGQRCTHLLRETYINPLCYMNNNVGKRIRFDARETISWLRSADCALLIQGWQEIAFMNPVNVVFVYLLVRDTLNTPESVRSVYELQANIMACLYLAFSYMGNEISYPLKPFLIEENRSIFWQRTVDLMNKLSGNMLKINREPRYFTELFYELKSYSVIKKSLTSTGLSIIPNPDLNQQRNSSYVADQENEPDISAINVNVQGQASQPIEHFQGGVKFSSQNNIGQNGRKRATLKARSSTFYSSYERPNHQVVFSSNEPQPVAYCI